MLIRSFLGRIKGKRDLTNLDELYGSPMLYFCLASTLNAENAEFFAEGAENLINNLEKTVMQNFYRK